MVQFSTKPIIPFEVTSTNRIGKPIITLDPLTIAFVLFILSGMRFSTVERKRPPDQLRAIIVGNERPTAPVVDRAAPAEFIVLRFSKEYRLTPLNPYCLKK